MKPFKLLPLAACLAIGLGTAGTAQAGAYAVSYDAISNGNVFVSAAGDLFFDTPQSTSAANASLNGTGVSNGGAGVLDAPVANAPGNSANEANNALLSLGQAGNYAWGDAQIISEQSATTPLSAWNAAETNVDAPGSFSAAGGNNGSGTLLTVILQVTQVGTFGIGFDASPSMAVLLTAGAEAGSQARADLRATATLSGLTGVNAGAQVFSWQPNGVVGTGITGGTELADACNLNLSLIQTVPGQQGYTPTCLIGEGGFDFLAISDPLAIGTYELDLAMQENVAAKYVPEPATLALLGVGLLGLGLSRRRRTA